MATTSSLSPRRSLRRKAIPLPRSGSLSEGSSVSKHESGSSDMALAKMSSRPGFTRTGRVSKAKKGLPVHHCHCGKSYTRAEHLRRHQKNHSSEPLLCDWPGCGKIFHRDDLLQRHRERHNEISKYSPSRGASVLSHSSAESDGGYKQSSTDFPVSGISSEALLPETMTMSAEPGLITSTSFHPSDVAASTSHDAFLGVHPNLSVQYPWTASPQYSSSSDYASPGLELQTSYAYQQPIASNYRTRTSSNASFAEPWPAFTKESTSPASATSTQAYEWPDTVKTPTLNAFGLSTGADQSYALFNPTIQTSIDSFPNFGMMMHPAKTYDERDNDERKLLFPYEGSTQSDDSFETNRNLENYWRHFHPSFPILHRASFDSEPPSPLLRAAMMGIGGQFATEASTKSASRTMNERCVKVLTQREFEVPLPNRLCDMQAIFLVEILSLFRGRRLSPQPSHRFSVLYSNLSQDGDIIPTTTLDNLVTPCLSLTDEHTRRIQWKEWIRISSKQRLLAACNILESQRALFLQRKPEMTILSSADIPMPAPSDVWEASSAMEWSLQLQLQQNMTNCSYAYEVLSCLNFHTFVGSLDAFQSALLISASYNPVKHANSYFANSDQAVTSETIHQSPQTQIYLLTCQLVQAAPIRDLLAVSGETWVLSEKISSVDEFNSLKRNVRVWITSLWSNRKDSTTSQEPQTGSKKAVEIALQICTIVLDGKHNTVLPGTEVGIYFAILILWVTTISASNNWRRAHIGTTSAAASPPVTPRPVPSNPPMSIKLSTLQHDAAEFLHTASASLHHDIASLSSSNAPVASVTPIGDAPPTLSRWQQGVSALMRLTRARLDTDQIPLGELLDGIAGVLQTLVLRGWAEDWF